MGVFAIFVSVRFTFDRSNINLHWPNAMGDGPLFSSVLFFVVAATQRSCVPGNWHLVCRTRRNEEKNIPLIEKFIIAE